MPNKPYKVLVLGLDGATYDLMLPWIDQGLLPSLGGLLGRGAWSPLESTIPPHTPCAWSSFITGKNPGKHGVFEFSEPVPGTYDFRFTNSACREGESLWGNLSRHGHRVGVVNVPMTYPPEEVNGFLISGLDTPHEFGRFMHPPDIRKDLEGAAIRYRVDLRYMGNMRSDERRMAMLHDLKDMETERTKAFQLLSERKPCDFSMLVYTATDRVSHHFWHYMDPDHDKYDAQRGKMFGDAIFDVYKHLDGLIGELLDKLDDRTIVMLMSDHGFGPTSNVRVQLNKALAQHGLLDFAREGNSGRVVRRAAAVVDKLLRSTLSTGVKSFLAGMLPKLRAKFEALDEAPIAWDKTRVFTNEAFRTCPAIWLNRASSRPEETINDSEQEDEALRQTEEALLSLRDPTTGSPVISKVYRGRDIYHGPCLHKAPDLIPSWWSDAFVVEQSSPGNGGVVRRSQEPVEGGVEFTGGHRLNGIFAMAGGPVKEGFAFDDAKIIDVAVPTVLYLMGQPIPSDMDGRPLTEAVDPEYVAQHPPTYTDDLQEGDDGRSAEEDAFTDEESEMIEKRLKSLGYL